METSALTPMSELEAINDMLSLIAESPVASLTEAQQVVDAQIAQQILERVNRQVQGQGWHWNTEIAMPFAPATDGTIPLPPNTLKLVSSDDSFDFVYRQGKLWDRVNQTFTINQTVYLDITMLLDFEDMPPVARTYVATRAGRMFENRMRGDGSSNQINERDEIEAKADMEQDEADNSRANVVANSPTVRRIAMGRFGQRASSLSGTSVANLRTLD